MLNCPSLCQTEVFRSHEPSSLGPPKITAVKRQCARGPPGTEFQTNKSIAHWTLLHWRFGQTRSGSHSGFVCHQRQGAAPQKFCSWQFGQLQTGTSDRSPTQRAGKGSRGSQLLLETKVPSQDNRQTTRRRWFRERTNQANRLKPLAVAAEVGKLNE